MAKVQRSFTLAETMIVITMIGLIAAVTIPSAIKRHSELVNITKVKNAMKLYSDVINRVIIDYKLNSNAQLSQFAESEGNIECQNVLKYFKYVERSGCTFRTDDGIWWNVSDFDNPMISVKSINTEESLAQAQENVTDSDDKTTFYFLASFDEDSKLRVNDLYYYLFFGDENEDEYMIKLWNYIENKKIGEKVSAFAKCNAKNMEICEVGNLTYRLTPIPEYNYTISTTNICDPEILAGENRCVGVSNYVSSTPQKSIYISDPVFLSADEQADAKSEETCKLSRDYRTCKTNGDYWAAAKRKCETTGGRLGNAGEIISLKDSNSNYRARGYWINEHSTSSAHALYVGANSRSISAVNMWHFRNDLQVLCVGE